MKKYEVQVDVTMSGRIEIEADSAEEAGRIAKKRQFVPSDLRNFCHVGNDVVEVDERRG